MYDHASEYHHLLTEHVLQPWYSRCLDLQYGGFRAGFDHAWRPTGERVKLLEFQARQTSAAAELLMCFPANELLRRAVQAGFAFLSGPMWDREHGGWFVWTDRSGNHIGAGDKHAHGTAYAIEACFLVSAATGNTAAADLGSTARSWLHDHAFEPDGGGYWGPMDRTGAVRKSGAGTQQTDHLGTPFGMMDMNVNKDVLSMLTCLARTKPKPADSAWLDGQLDFVLRRFAGASCPYHFINRQGRPVSNYWKPSEAAQLAGILIEAMPHSTRTDELLEAARKVAEKSYLDGWDSGVGGLLLSTHEGVSPSRTELAAIAWWPQFELLKAATYLSRLDPQYELTERMMRQAWTSITSWFVDRRHGGLYARSSRTVPFISRVLKTRRHRNAGRKGGIWKDASHEARALVRLLQVDRALAGQLPAELDTLDRSLSHFATDQKV